jgi:hypothetical protein
VSPLAGLHLVLEQWGQGELTPAGDLSLALFPPL